jgi:hypothetical protein
LTHVPFLLLGLCRGISLIVWLLWLFRNMSKFLRRGVVNTSPNPQSRRTPLVGCPRLLIQYIRSYPPHLEAVPPSATWGRAMPWCQEFTCHDVHHRPSLRFGIYICLSLLRWKDEGTPLTGSERKGCCQSLDRGSLALSLEDRSRSSVQRCDVLGAQDGAET